MNPNSIVYQTARWAFQPVKHTKRAVLEVTSAPKRRAVIHRYLSKTGFKGLQIGCGPNILPGWLNSDATDFGNPDVVVDITRKLPLPDASLDAIYGSEVVEHIPRESVFYFLSEARRVLGTDGVLRLTTPDMVDVCKIGLGLNAQCTVKMLASTWLEDDNELTPDIWVNAMFRRWGHQHLWDFPSMRRALHDAGFAKVFRVDPQVTKSSYAELQNIDNRYGMPSPAHCWSSSMIIEAS